MGSSAPFSNIWRQRICNLQDVKQDHMDTLQGYYEYNSHF
jgi:hypothetical protein